MKAFILISAPLLGSLLYFFVFQPFIDRDRYIPIVAKCYLKDGTPMHDMVYILDTHTGTRKRDWEK